MASNQTANFGLNQWEATDKVLREEFNADNAKIDKALEGLSLRPAMEVVRSWENTVSGSQIDIDLSDVDLNQYMWLRVNFQNIPATSNITVAAYINGLVDSTLYQTLNLATTTGMSATAYAGLFETAKHDNATYSLSGEFEFDCSAPWLFGRYRAFYYDVPQQRQWHCNGYWTAFPAKLSRSEVQFFRLTVSAGHGTLDAGGRIMIYGQKLYQN